MKRAALVGGVVYALMLLAAPLVLEFGNESSVDSFIGALASRHVEPWLWWILLGGALVGAVLAITYCQYGLVTPTLSVVSVYLVSMLQMWQLLRAPHPLLPGTPYDSYYIGWAVLLGLALIAGVIEQRVRQVILVDVNSDVA